MPQTPAIPFFLSLLALLALTLPLGFAVGRFLCAAREAALREQLRAAEARSTEALAAVRRLEARSRELEAALAAAREAAAGLRSHAHRVPELEQQVQALTSARSALQADQARLESQLNQAQQRAAQVEHTEERLRDAFRALSGDALERNNQAFLELARATLQEFQTGARDDLAARQREIAHVVAPIQSSLGQLDGALQEIERARLDAYASLREQVSALRDGHGALQVQTGQLVRALRSPSTRGRWGEVHLRRVIEMAGMVENCDFEEQVHLRQEDGALRPDVIVRLPGGKTSVVDAKAPMGAYLDALEAPDDTARRACLRDHARQVKAHVTQLASKGYAASLASSPDFVILYMPCESAFAAAVQEDPDLIEYAVGLSVIPAGPMTLLTHLKAAAYGWRQDRVAHNTERISELGRELYHRIGTLVAHVSAIGLHLGRAGEAYNQAVGSLERRVLTQARRFHELGAATGDRLPEPELLSLGLRGAPTAEPGEP
jgi:DNA recombination protein RmuC